MNVSFFGELLQSISDRGRALIDRARDRRVELSARTDSLVDLCEELLSRRGEASGVALARDILSRYAELKTGPRVAFFESLATRFGADHQEVDRAIEAWRNDPTDSTATAVHLAAEPRRQELFRRLNLAPGGTAALVRMREHLLDVLERREDLRAVDADFGHLFSSWFNRGFLVLRRIDWSTPANILEKLIRYEAVHRIRGFDDLRRRIDPRDRRCYAFFHPAMVDEPLIFVEVALTQGIAGAIGPILAAERDIVEKPDTAVFYSISNCQRGLAGVSFGHFLIKQVVEDICKETPAPSTFVTLSPVPGFAGWLARERKTEVSVVLTEDDKAVLANLDSEGWWEKPQVREPMREPLMRAAAWYFVNAKNSRGMPVDSVARFHLGNGARLEMMHWLADDSEHGIAQSCGLMVNYRYELSEIEKNHEAYAERRSIAASSAIKRLVRAAPRELVPAGK